jgi:hypothetical protein
MDDSKLEKDNRSFLKKLWCKLFHTDERYIDSTATARIKTICLAHKCFNKSLFISKFWLEDEFGQEVKEWPRGRK